MSPRRTLGQRRCFTYDSVGCFTPPASAPGASMARAATTPLMAGSGGCRSTVACPWQRWRRSSSSIYGGAGPPLRQQCGSSSSIYDCVGPPLRQQCGFPSSIYDGAAFDNDDLRSMAAVAAWILLLDQWRHRSSSMAVVWVPLLGLAGLDLGSTILFLKIDF
jgi:hypothetical protein